MSASVQPASSKASATHGVGGRQALRRCGKRWWEWCRSSTAAERGLRRWGGRVPALTTCHVTAHRLTALPLRNAVRGTAAAGIAQLEEEVMKALCVIAVSVALLGLTTAARTDEPKKEDNVTKLL